MTDTPPTREASRAFRCIARHAVLASLLATAPVLADEGPSFDRPGLSFSTSTLPAGGFAWEQGLPDASSDRSDGIRTTTWVADTLLRLGMTDTIELQLGADSWGGMRVQGHGGHRSEHGGGDGWVSVKWAPATDDETFSWALLATRSLPFGAGPLGDGGQDYGLGVTAAWALPADTGVSLYANREWGDDGGGWMFSTDYGFPLGEGLEGFVEAGYGTGATHARVAGAGLAWMATTRLQLDVSFLRGLDRRSPDWQGGVGMAWYFD